jgi:hypothetical protein
MSGYDKATAAHKFRRAKRLVIRWHAGKPDLMRLYTKLAIARPFSPNSRLILGRPLVRSQ